MSVEIDPAELGFRRPFTVEVAQILKIKNTNNQPVAFKVKTTAPKQYCVRPNSGRIEPDHEVEVSVLLQAMKQDPPLDAKCRDKFLVQSVLITGDKDFTTVQEIWDSVEKSAIQERKIRVIWQAPNSGAAAPVATPVKNLAPPTHVEATPDAPPPAYASPVSEPTAPKPPPQNPAREIKKEKSESDSPTATPSGTSTSSHTPSTAQPALEQVKARVAEAATSATAFGETAGLKARKAILETKPAAAAPAKASVQQVHPAAQQQPVTDGVPVQLVAILCLLSFLLAYFFF